MKRALVLIVAAAALAFGVTESFAQVYVSPAPQVVYRPAMPAYAYPAYAAPQVIVNRPAIFADPIVKQAPIVTNYPPVASAPIVTNYAPSQVGAPVISQQSTVVGAAPVVTPTQIMAPAPIVTYRPAPLVTYRPAPVITYRQPVTYVPPTVTGYGGNISTVYAVPVVAQPAIVRTKVYYPGQSIRNVLRAITP